MLVEKEAVDTLREAFRHDNPEADDHHLAALVVLTLAERGFLIVRREA